MSRKQFIESHGATCKNWTWSWSFVNHAEGLVIFGAWDAHRTGRHAAIMSTDWKTSLKGNKKPGYEQALEHLRLIEEKGYRLMTFPMEYSEVEEKAEFGTATIAGFTPVLTEKALSRVGHVWYALDVSDEPMLPEQVQELEMEGLVEGAATSVLVNAYERNREARARCLAHYGHSCQICSFDFEAVYGPIGRGYIHVHHIKLLSEIRGEYVVDPIKDLIPLCPNCHGMIHSTRPAMEVEQLRHHLESRQAVLMG